MWFQDLFNYDFRRTEQCIIPYATQEGEISFCAYNTGVGWRNIVEKMHMTATLTKWYEENGRHEIIAGGKNVNLPSKDHSLVLRADDVTHGSAARSGRQGHRQDGSRREEARSRSEADQRGRRRMAKLYRQHVLKEEAGSGTGPVGRNRSCAEAGGEACGRGRVFRGLGSGLK